MKPSSIVALSSLLLLCAGCGAEPRKSHPPQLISDAEAERMGAQVFTRIRQDQPPSRNATFTRRASCVTEALINTTDQSQWSWELAVFANAEVGAFSLPGGKIGINDGIETVAPDTDTLAGALSTVVAQAALRHAQKRLSSVMIQQLGIDVLRQSGTTTGPNVLDAQRLTLMRLPTSRSEVGEADIFGQELMARAGFDPRQSVTLWQNIENVEDKSIPEILSTHPSSETRIRYLRAQLPKVMPLYDQARSQGRVPHCP